MKKERNETEHNYHNNIEVILDKKYTEPKVIIYAKEKNEEIESIISAIQKADVEKFSAISGKHDGMMGIIQQRDIIRARTEGRKVVVDTDQGKYTVKYSLTSLEEKFDGKRFFRISQSEIINLYRVKHFDVRIAGTVLVEFDNGDKTYVARRFVRSLKDRLKNEGLDAKTEQPSKNAE
ncbi:MAG: LytTR family transcriptional regulator [Lachnospiraceae bacterium]|nr:LytTR family transcriptional regulator [Lachnospiraceae bacterium]